MKSARFRFEMQGKLLRVLENREIQRVGSPAVKNVDVRVIAATNRNLQELVAEKKFREDLYYRLSMVEIELPRLADRREDFPRCSDSLSTNSPAVWESSQRHHPARPDCPDALWLARKHPGTQERVRERLHDGRRRNGRCA